MCAEILENPSLLRLGGQRCKVTVLFADIKGFTALSEKMEPEKVVEVLNTFFTEMVELVFQHQGTLDKFLGDALMADFGRPRRRARAPGTHQGAGSRDPGERSHLPGSGGGVPISARAAGGAAGPPG